MASTTKRYFDSNLITGQKWFVQLPSWEYRLFFMWMIGNCDIGGVWDPDTYQFDLAYGTSINLDDFFSAVNSGRKSNENPRIIKLKNGRWFVVGFVTFQSVGTKISRDAGPHRSFLAKWCINNIHPFDVFGEHSNICQELTHEWLHEKIGYPMPDRLSIDYGYSIDRLSIDYKYPSDRLSIDYAYSTDSLRIERDNKGNKDLGVSIGETSIAHEEEIIISSNTTSLSEKKSSKKNPENSGAKKRGRPRKNPVPLIAETPELVTGSGVPISPKPERKPKQSADTPLAMPFDSEEFSTNWTKWCTYLKQRCKVHKEKYPYEVQMTEQEALNNVKVISGSNEQVAIQCISFSISKGWKSICKPNQQQQSNAATTNGINHFDPLAAIGGEFAGVFSSPSFTASPGRAVRERGATIADLQALKRNRGTNTGS